MLKDAPRYHAHIYFEDGQQEAAIALHRQARQELGALATVWPMRERPVGPHPLPMFEIEFPHESRDRVVAWVEAHHGALTVLLHPEGGDDLADHTRHAVWLGGPLALDLSVL